MVVFTSDGKLVASGSDDRTVKLWDTATGAPQQTLEGHSDSVNAVAFSSDGKLVASSSYDGRVKLWDAITGALQQTLDGHSDQANAVAISSDGNLVASGSDDHTVKLWDVATGALQQTLEGHSDWVLMVAFSSDGKRWRPAPTIVQPSSGIRPRQIFALDTELKTLAFLVQRIHLHAQQSLIEWVDCSLLHEDRMVETRRIVGTSGTEEKLDHREYLLDPHVRFGSNS
jgi:WD40 repeat protein